MTTFSIDFNFTSADQTKVLTYLQQNNYQLLGYKGATGAGQIGAGVPTWFAVPFGNMFGMVEIDYTPKYKVYVFNRAKIAAYTTIQMQGLSGEIDLGTGLIFNQNGTFSAGSNPSSSTAIKLEDNRKAGSPDVTVGLAGLVNLPSGQQFLPFCAFNLPPQSAIEMAPVETICLMAARTDLLSGNVQASASAPGCSFTFGASNIKYELKIEDSTYAIASAGGLPVTAVSSGAALAQILNK